MIYDVLLILGILIFVLGWLYLILKFRYANKYKTLFEHIKILVEQTKDIFKKIKFKK